MFSISEVFFVYLNNAVASPPLPSQKLILLFVVCVISKVETLNTIFNLLLWTQRKVKTRATVYGNDAKTLLCKAQFIVEISQ